MSRGEVVRMWEVRVRPGRSADYLRLLRTDVLPALAATDGLLAAELFGTLDDERGAETVGADGAGGSGVDEPADGADERIVLVSRWRDQAALAAAAGPGWRTDPVDRPDELALQARPAHVWHFTAFG